MMGIKIGDSFWMGIEIGDSFLLEIKLGIHSYWNWGFIPV
jgi:hypothetical protein